MDDLLARCIRGDSNAWHTFVDRYTRVIYSAVGRVLGRRTQARSNPLIDDLTQDVFLRLVRNDFRLLRSFDPTRASLTTFLTIVARSTTLDQLRRRRVETVGLDQLAEPAQQKPDDPSEATEAIQIPPDLLSPRQRLVMELLFNKEMTVVEAAAVIGVDAQTVRSTKHKALTKLRRYFGQE